ncbi:Crp/Fnr family transcriptional regulator [Umezawaea sp.]|uniref:Crp/Fnr family transcriptional regulator n=1 Tax=Umezawaea sp. TaxID=1955258 RepID=UPI002ECFF351
MSNESRAQLLKLGTARTYENDKRILEQGASNDHVVVVLRGTVKVVAYSEYGPTLLAIRVRGDLVGEQAGIDKNPRSASVIACGEVLVRTIALNELKRVPEVDVQVQRMVSERWRSSDQLRVDFFGRNARAKLARVLIEIATMGGWEAEPRWELKIPLKRAELGSLASMPPSTADKQMRQLIVDGLVAAEQQRITLLDTEALRLIADSH